MTKKLNILNLYYALNETNLEYLRDLLTDRINEGYRLFRN